MFVNISLFTLQFSVCWSFNLFYENRVLSFFCVPNWLCLCTLPLSCMNNYVVFNSQTQKFQRTVVAVRITLWYSVCLIFIPIPIFIHTYMYTDVIAVLKKLTVICFCWFLSWYFASSVTRAVQFCSWS